MKIELKKINKQIGDQEYQMYQEIPKEENGAINEGNNLSKEEFSLFLDETIEEEKKLFTMYTTPRITYILYIDDYPVGEVKIRPLLNQYWYELSGNIGYKIRPSERGKGYGNIILEEILKVAKKMSLETVFLQCQSDNIPSKKVILHNKGILIKEEQNIAKYKIKL